MDFSNPDSLENIFETVKNCQKCRLHRFRDKCVFAEGEVDAEIMLVGLSPGKEENATGRLFVGPSGDFLNMLLRLAGIDRKSLYITNIIKCHAPTYEIGQREIETCSLYLNRQIEIIKPAVIIPLGSVATRYILEKHKLPLQKISEIHGQVLHTGGNDLFGQSRNTKIIPMFHPAAALRTPELSESIKMDWQGLSGKS